MRKLGISLQTPAFLYKARIFLLIDLRDLFFRSGGRKKKKKKKKSSENVQSIRKKKHKKKRFFWLSFFFSEYLKNKITNTELMRY